MLRNDFQFKHNANSSPKKLLAFFSKREMRGKRMIFFLSVGFQFSYCVDRYVFYLKKIYGSHKSHNHEIEKKSERNNRPIIISLVKRKCIFPLLWKFNELNLFLRFPGLEANPRVKNSNNIKNIDIFVVRFEENETQIQWTT